MDRILVVLYFEASLKNGQSPYAELKQRYQALQSSLWRRSVISTLALLNAYCLVVKANRKAVLAVNIMGFGFSLLNWKYHAFDDVVELMAEASLREAA